jgi:hypothetical protein
MNDDLRPHLDEWEAPSMPEPAQRRIAALLDDRTLPGPLPAARQRGRALPLAYGIAVATLVAIAAPRAVDDPSVLRHRVVVTPALVGAASATSPASAAVAVSAIDLDGFELIARPRMRVHRRTP